MFIFYSKNKIAQEIVQKALIRSHPVKSEGFKIYVFISPTDESFQLIKELSENKSKIIILGSITASVASLLGLSFVEEGFPFNKSIACLDENKAFNASDLYISYYDHELLRYLPYKQRFFTRFDFTNEWNNHGYGRIGVENDCLSVKTVLSSINTTSLAKVYCNGDPISEFMIVKDFEKSSVLYINREVGLVDGLDWTIVEQFCSSYRSENLPCAPLLKDLPHGLKGVASARLDCDQSVINSESLVNLYKSYDINLSLAITTGIDISAEEISFLNNYHLPKGSLVSHTVNHFFNWGSEYSVAFNEAARSKDWLEKNVNAIDNVQYAVSPFHTNKPYSVEALSDAGYKGFVSGIIHNDPEYLMAVSGQVPFTNKKIVSHSQQCMMHGDCYHRYGNSINPYKEAFNFSYKAEKMFGYLDHPFGDYDYGWSSEEERLKAHEEFIKYINSHDGVAWLTIGEILDFVYKKSTIKIYLDEFDNLIVPDFDNDSEHKVEILYKGSSYVY